MSINKDSAGGRAIRSSLPALASLCLLCVFLLLFYSTTANAFSNFLTQFSNRYPASTSDNTGCQLCHQDALFGGQPWNAYGWALRQTVVGGVPDFAAVENLDSDGQGHTNLEEINANTQPGWCDASSPNCPDNDTYNRNGTTQAGTPPAGVVLDPIVVVIPCTINLSPAQVNFGSHTIGNTGTQQLTVSNSGEQNCNVSSVALTTGTSNEFAVQPPTSFTVAPMTSQVVTLTYTPADVGPDTGGVSVTSNDSASPATASLSGNGDPIPVCDIVVPAAVNFGALSVGTTSTMQVTIGNNGTAACTTTVSLTSGTSSEYAVLPPTSFTIQPGNSQLVDVSYSPVDAGADMGGLSVASNDPDGTAIVDLMGSGVPVAECNIGVSPLALNYGDVILGQSATRQTTVSNSGAADCTVSVSLTGGTSGEYLLQGPSNFTVAPNGSQVVSIDYTPANLGMDMGGLQVSSNDPDTASVTVDLTANAIPMAECNLNVTPNTVNFGLVTVGNTASQSLSLSNGGMADCVISSFALGSPNSEFTLPGGLTVAPGTTQQVTISYSPADMGVDNAVLNVNSNDPASPDTVSLTGEGSVPVCDIDVSPISLGFGTLTIGTTGSQNVTVSNAGDASCTVSSVALTAGTSSEYAVQGPGSFSVAPGASQVVAVDYTPADVGMDTGGISVVSDDPVTPSVVVSLSGTGQQEQEPPIGGEALYLGHCAGCHGDPTTGGPAPAAPRKVAGARECSIHAAIFGNPNAGNDTPFPNGVPAMQSLQGALTAMQIQDISNYLNSFAVTGEQRFVTTCAGCHGLDARGGFVGENVRGEDAREIREAISDERPMRFLGCLPSPDTQQIGNYLSSLGKDKDRDDDDDDDDKKKKKKKKQSRE